MKVPKRAKKSDAPPPEPPKPPDPNSRPRPAMKANERLIGRSIVGGGAPRNS